MKTGRIAAAPTVGLGFVLTTSVRALADDGGTAMPSCCGVPDRPERTLDHTPMAGL